MATINTEGAGYLAYLEQIREIYALIRTTYGPVTKRMTAAQLKQLYQADPIFKEVIDMAKDVAELAQRVEIEL